MCSWAWESQADGKIHHQTWHWLVFLDCPNAFNTIKRAEVAKKVAVRAPGLAPFVSATGRSWPTSSTGWTAVSKGASRKATGFTRATPLL